jgi:flagellar biosynthesis protein FlhF
MQQYFIEQAGSYIEAERKAREKYGDNVTILMHESVKIPGGFLNLFSREGVKLTGIIPSGISSFRKSPQYRDAQKENSQPLKPQFYKEQPLTKEIPRQAPLDFAEAKEKVLAAANNAGKDSAMEKVLALMTAQNAEVRIIKEKLESSDLAGSREEHPTLNRIDDILILNDFPSSYRKALLEKIRKEISLDALNNYQAVQDMVLEWIGESIKIYEAGKFNIRPRIMILVGPTGVGKTTTVAKLAANFGIDSRKRTHKRKVVLITIDAYRIGAKEQIEKYSEYMQFPCFSTVDYEELKTIIATNSEGTDLILIDTIGKNPRDMEELGKMKKLLDACGTLAEIYLVAAATTKSSDLKEILQQFEAFNYRSVIITKMDETIRSGNVIGVLSEKNKSIAYITNGQKVPAEIKEASVIKFLTNLEGFKVNRNKLEDKFPDKAKGQMQEWV